jgi:hypothetical protein
VSRSARASVRRADGLMSSGSACGLAGVGALLGSFRTPTVLWRLYCSACREAGAGPCHGALALEFPCFCKPRENDALHTN